FRGVWRVIALLSSMDRLPPEEAIAMATGNTARIYELESGVIRKGMAADLVAIDTPIGSPGRDALEALKEGNVPAVAMIMIDGEVKSFWGKNTEPPMRRVEVKYVKRG
ncbi:MAG: Enamidase, partial [Candidatus Hecatellales archaeon]